MSTRPPDESGTREGIDNIDALVDEAMNLKLSVCCPHANCSNPTEDINITFEPRIRDAIIKKLSEDYWNWIGQAHVPFTHPSCSQKFYARFEINALCFNISIVANKDDESPPNYIRVPLGTSEPVEPPARGPTRPYPPVRTQVPFAAREPSQREPTLMGPLPPLDKPSPAPTLTLPPEPTLPQIPPQLPPPEPASFPPPQRIFAPPSPFVDAPPPPPTPEPEAMPTPEPIRVSVSGEYEHQVPPRETQVLDVPRSTDRRSFIVRLIRTRIREIASGLIILMGMAGAIKLIQSGRPEAPETEEVRQPKSPAKKAPAAPKVTPAKPGSKKIACEIIIEKQEVKPRCTTPGGVLKVIDSTSTSLHTQIHFRDCIVDVPDVSKKTGTNGMREMDCQPK